MSKKLPRCAHCDRLFSPDRYNVLHQECCRHPDCVLERKRKRQREWYARKYRDDPEFADTARKRCAAANRKRRAREVPVSGDATVGQADTSALALYKAVSGVISQLTDASDPAQLLCSIRRYRERGRRMALCAPTGTDPP